MIKIIQILIQIKKIQTFRTVQLLNLDKKWKDTSFPLHVFLQAWSSSKFTVQWRRRECCKELTVCGVS